MQNAQASSLNVLLVYPRFLDKSFWNYKATCEATGARYPAAPLGLITLAALLPAEWNLRLINRNTEALTDADIAWADVVMTGGMLMQQFDTLELIDLIQAHGKPVAVGGPDISSSPHVYEQADFKVIGEAEDIIKDLVAAIRRGERQGRFEAEKFQVDVTTSPVPRFDLLKFDHYLHVGVQFSRGCPFTCEFCDIIELYGRVPRAKTNAQMLKELDALYACGYRGHVDFVDDNMIGNKKALKKFLPELVAWQKERGYPFEFSTEASVNLADDDELLRHAARSELLRRVRRHRNPGSRHAGADVEEAEHAPRPRRQHPQDLRRGDLRDGRVHRRLRRREERRRPRHHRLHRGCRHSHLHGRPALRPAEHAADAPSGEGRPLVPQSRRDGQPGRRSMLARAELRDDPAAPGNPARLPGHRPRHL